ncbi:hypothetical protein Vretimale_6027 [Volvox reticuliferus]|uniref:Uncharacterized protein n=1 Tax=Volvox reticuliferus TaxID=1737510 RepID=A0A8J4C6L3_9CHLO|nr:hypothetical protein Vretifemale_6179 [Volvox reticuliferus]GIM01205.1 hypothetical protein Vretimale_6027 [Volvox reticuliferus]
MKVKRFSPFMSVRFLKSLLFASTHLIWFSGVCTLLCTHIDIVIPHSPTFLALSCPLDGEAITCVSGGNAAINDMTASPLGSAAGGGGGPPVAIQVVSEAHRGEVEAAAAELLQQRVALLAERGVNLLLLCGRPPPAATQLCHQHGICLVAGLDEQDVARACAAGGAAAPLTRAGLRVLAEAQLGRASAARVVLLGTRRAILLEFTEQQWQAAGQAACTLLLCGVSDAAIKQSVREVRRCLISIAAAVGTMAQHGIDAHARSGAEGGHGCGECLVFVAGGGGFEGLLEFQLRELSDVAKKGLPTSQTDEKVEEEEDLDDVELSNAGVAVAETGTAAEAAVDGVEDAAAEARAASELLASLRVLHAMAAVVPMALTGASGGGGGRGTSQRRVRREALLQVHALRQSQAAVLQRGELVRCGLVVPSAAASFHGRALHGVSGEEALEGWEAPFLRGADGQSKTSFIREQPAIGGDGFVAVPNAVHYGVVEAAAVAVSAWNHAVDVVRQVIRIEGAPVAAVSGSQLRGGGDGGVQVTVAGPAAVKMPRARRGGGGREWSSDSSSGGASDES